MFGVRIGEQEGFFIGPDLHARALIVQGDSVPVEYYTRQKIKGTGKFFPVRNAMEAAKVSNMCMRAREQWAMEQESIKVDGRHNPRRKINKG